ncbi:uncharacterized protein (TIGR03083 family) [Kribbella amoyensis]|uniref:Uncharacterized protein (TIGR03083 family) n=1 Tax=Kribbella amoyensis TaxID=996641 RepID=A0A561B812_9ACTN|nr:maleylpyruvate isomerase family mycothiol-dependent enzyme [Kribbella amoyensis]TWD75106.1 uncharacterized protein (TIGR03083 family) [Kribbella amoyensis]
MTDIRAAIAGERTDLAGLLATLPADDWDRPTLCAGWRVREVVAHLTMPYRYSGAAVLRGVLRARGNFNRFADRAARKDAATLSAGDLVTSLRDNVNHPWKPPGSGPEAALSHDVVHGLDITVGLGLDRVVPLDRLRLVLDGTDRRSVKYFGVDLAGIQLRATDLDWTYGTGEPVTGRAQDLLLAVCGRTLPAGRLTGTEAARFTGGVGQRPGAP